MLRSFYRCPIFNRCAAFPARKYLQNAICSEVISTPETRTKGNLYVVSLVGTVEEINIATQEIKKIANTLGYNSGVIKIIPDKSLQTNGLSNQAWKMNLHTLLRDTKFTLLINQIGNVNCEQVIDFNKSVRELRINRRPLTFKIDPHARTPHEKSALYNSKRPYERDCSEINQVYPLAGSIHAKTKSIELWIDPIYFDWR